MGASEITVDTLCGSCGGHAQVLRAGNEGVLECPWCSARLEPDEKARDAQLDHLHGIAEQEVAIAGAALWATIPESLRSPESGPTLPPGFRESAGGIVGTFRDIPIWTLSDVVEDTEIRRLELTADTGCAFRVAFVWAEAEASIRKAARAWHYPLPEIRRATWAYQWHVYPDSKEPLDLRETLVIPLHRLRPGDALIIDGAGISLWRTSLTITESILQQQERLADLIAELRAGSQAG